MIKPNQKLQHGDYFQNGTKEEYSKLLNIEDKSDIFTLSQCLAFKNIVASSDTNTILIWSEGPKDIDDPTIIEYNFIDFHKLCINTFGDIWNSGKKLKSNGKEFN